MLQRLSSIGCRRSGQSTAGEVLHRTLECPSLQLNARHDQKACTSLDVTRFHGEVSEFIDRHDDWIIDGNSQTVADLIQSRCTDIICLDRSLPRMLIRVFLRILRRSVGRIGLWNDTQERFRDLCSLEPERSMRAPGRSRPTPDIRHGSKGCATIRPGHMPGPKGSIARETSCVWFAWRIKSSNDAPHRHSSSLCMTRIGKTENGRTGP